MRSTRRPRPCSKRARPPAPRAIGPPRIDCATSSRSVAWRSRTPAMGSAGGGCQNRSMADRPRRDREDDRPPDGSRGRRAPGPRHDGGPRGRPPGHGQRPRPYDGPRRDTFRGGPPTDARRGFGWRADDRPDRPPARPRRPSRSAVSGRSAAGAGSAAWAGSAPGAGSAARRRVGRRGPAVLRRVTIAGRATLAFHPALAVRGSIAVQRSAAAHIRRARPGRGTNPPPPSNPSPRTRSSSPGGAPSRRPSSRAAALTGCWSRRSAGTRSSSSSSMPLACGSRSSRSKAVR